tara:strand:+ start:824 stop:1198 length:375 start_codon:yes stop_codon:yes gene_type:complete
MPLPPSHNNFYDNEDSESDYDQAEADTSPWASRRKKSRVQYHGGAPAGYAKDQAWADSKKEPRAARFTDVGSPVVYPDTPTGRAMVERLNKGYHPDNPKYYVKGDTPAEREKERAKRLSFGGGI